MSLILSLDTSTDVCSVALHDKGKLLEVIKSCTPQAHGSQLAILIEELFKKADRRMGNLCAVAVSAGPGSYTGLRIGVSTAKGICFALNIPLIAVGTLQLMAYQLKEKCKDNVYLCPMLDARRMEVYCLLTDCKQNIIEPAHPKIIDSSSFQQELLEREILFFGNGSGKCKAVITHPHAHFVDDIVPEAKQLGEIAYNRLMNGEVENLESFEPVYLKEFMVKKAKSQL